jgi:hypothetical protein
MMGAKFLTAAACSADPPQMLFTQQAPRGGEGARAYRFDVAKDGRFLMIEDLPPATTGPLTVVVNWDTELKRRLFVER